MEQGQRSIGSKPIKSKGNGLHLRPNKGRPRSKRADTPSPSQTEMVLGALDRAMVVFKATRGEVMTVERLVDAGRGRTYSIELVSSKGVRVGN